MLAPEVDSAFVQRCAEPISFLIKWRALAHPSTATLHLVPFLAVLHEPLSACSSHADPLSDADVLPLDSSSGSPFPYSSPEVSFSSHDLTVTRLYYNRMKAHGDEF